MVAANLMEEQTCTSAGPIIGNPSSRQGWLATADPLTITNDTTPRQKYRSVALSWCGLHSAGLQAPGNAEVDYKHPVEWQANGERVLPIRGHCPGAWLCADV